MFPVITYEDGVELPETGTYYLIAANGCFLHKDTGIVHGLIPVDSIPVLQSLSRGATIGCRLPKIPAIHVHRIKEFFKRVVAKHHSEATTTLYFSPDEKKYKIVIPEQEVSHGGVNYDRKGLSHVKGFENWLRVGTIHSHCDFGAYHSSTDVGDEKDFDGIHLTFGHNDKDLFTISCSIVVNGFRAKCDPQRFIQGVESMSDFKEPSRFSVASSEQRFRLVKVPTETQQKWFECIDEKWMPKVKPKSFSWFGGTSNANVKYIDDDKITTGDSVRFKDDPRVSIYKRLIGYGPYNVTRASQSEPTIVIETKLGKARFSKELFEKAYRWTQPSYGIQKKVEVAPKQNQMSRPAEGTDYYGNPDTAGGDLLSGLFGTKRN